MPRGRKRQRVGQKEADESVKRSPKIPKKKKPGRPPKKTQKRKAVKARKNPPRRRRKKRLPSPPLPSPPLQSPNDEVINIVSESDENEQPSKAWNPPTVASCMATQNAPVLPAHTSTLNRKEQLSDEEPDKAEDKRKTFRGRVVAACESDQSLSPTPTRPKRRKSTPEPVTDAKPVQKDGKTVDEVEDDEGQSDPVLDVIDLHGDWELERIPDAEPQEDPHDQDEKEPLEQDDNEDAGGLEEEKARLEEEKLETQPVLSPVDGEEPKEGLVLGSLLSSENGKMKIEGEVRKKELELRKKRRELEERELKLEERDQKLGEREKAAETFEEKQRLFDERQRAFEQREKHFRSANAKLQAYAHRQKRKKEEYTAERKAFVLEKEADREAFRLEKESFEKQKSEWQAKLSSCSQLNESERKSLLNELAF